MSGESGLGPSSRTATANAPASHPRPGRTLRKEASTQTSTESDVIVMRQLAGTYPLHRAELEARVLALELRVAHLTELIEAALPQNSSASGS
jgi:hypothetical protein